MLKKSLLLMTLFLALLGVARAQSTLTIYEEGTNTSTYVPVYGTWADAYLKCEFVVPADQLSDMAGGTISQMDFAVKTAAAEAWAGTFQVFLMEVSDTSISAYYGPSAATIVYVGSLDATADPMTVEFSTDYTYGGGNLLVGVYQTNPSNWKGATFQGQNVTGACVQGYSSSSLDAITATQRGFIPTTTFTYEAAAGGCDMPASIAVNDITHNSATVTWEGDGSAWNLRYKKSTDTDFTMVEGLTAKSYNLGSLTENTAYNVGVQTVCTGATSNFRSTSFTTANPCAAPTDLTFSGVTASSATLNWKAGYQETSWTVKYKKSAEAWDDAKEESVSGTPTLTLTGLDGLTTYNVRVFNCEAYVSGNFTTAASFPYAQDFSGSGIPTGWTQYTGLLADVMAGTATLTSTSYGWTVGTDHSVLDGNHAYSNIYGTSCKKWLVTPAIPMQAGARLTFDVAYTAYSSSATDPAQDGEDDKFVVLASTDNMATWTILRQWDNAGSEYVLNDLTPTTLPLNFDMAAYAGTNLIIAFYGESTVNNADNNIHVDNVVFELIPSCEKPTNVVVNYEGGTTATVSFNSDAEAWNLDVNGTVTPITTNPYTIEGLELATTYNVKVQANCGGTTSEWSNTQSFATDMCLPENQCQLTFILKDSYGDGWNGNAIKVIDVATNTELASMAADAHGGGGVASTDTKYLSVCDGREIKFTWVKGSYPDEASWEIYDINEELITSGTGTTSMSTGDVLATYMVNCTVTTCRKPTNLKADAVFGHSVILSWTENGEATEWIVAYASKKGDEFGEYEEVAASTNPYTLEGLEPETDYSVKVRPVCEPGVEKWSDAITFTTDVACAAPANVVVSEIEPLSAKVSWEGEAENYNLRYRELTAADFVTVTLYAEDVWQDGTGYQMLLDETASTYGTIIPETGGLTSSGDASAETYAAFAYKIPTNADGAMSTTNVLIAETVSIQIPAGTYDWCITNPTPGDRIWIASSGGNIGGRYNDYVFEAGSTYYFHVYKNTNTGNDAVDLTITPASTKDDPRDVEWVEINSVTSPYTIAVEPEKDYRVEVQSDCDTYGTSAWEGTNFTTPSNCQVPQPLDVTEITAYTATLNWNGLQESFQAQYRTAGSRELLFFEDFDDQPSTWTLTNSSYFQTSSATTDYLVGVGYNSTETGYLITPELDVEKGTVEFKQRCYNGAVTFQVGFSSTTNDVDAFDWGSEIDAAAVMFTSYSVAMPDGTKYVAIKSTSTDANICVIVNDFGIYGNEIPAGEWVSVTANATTCPISGLASGTTYEWQVRGVAGSCTGGYTEWSDIRTFTTLPSCLVPTDLDVDDDNITAESAVITWVSEAASFDLDVDGIIIEDVTSPYPLDGLTPNTLYTIKVRANCGGGDYSAWSSAVSFTTECPTSYALPYAYNFDDVINAAVAPDINCWFGNSFNTANSIGFAYRDQAAGDVMLQFSSYYSADDYRQFLATPEFDTEEAVSVEFEYRAYNTSAETFQVGYSSTLTFDDFEWDDAITTSDSDWHVYSKTFPAGTKYVGILYQSEYQYYLYVDNFKFTEVLPITQETDLEEGWNWFSTYIVVDDPMDMLTTVAESLSDNVDEWAIWAVDDFINSDDLGDLEEMYNEQMYAIYVSEDVTVSIDGLPTNPAEYPLTIEPGWNWIGFPCTETVSIEDAFADFEAVDGDMIWGSEEFSSYADGEWGDMGDLEELAAGQGYKFYSASTTTRTLIFSTGAKKSGRKVNFDFGTITNQNIQSILVGNVDKQINPNQKEMAK